MVRAEILAEVSKEINRQVGLTDLPSGVTVSEFDKGNTRNDWIAFINRYASGAADRLAYRQDLDFREAMIKVAALAVAAIEAHDAGYCQ